MWDMKCRFAPDNPSAKHCKATNSGQRWVVSNRRKKSGVVGKGYFGCCNKCNVPLKGVD
jgi:hypothetical protein